MPRCIAGAGNAILQPPGAGQRSPSSALCSDDWRPSISSATCGILVGSWSASQGMLAGSPRHQAKKPRAATINPFLTLQPHPLAPPRRSKAPLYLLRLLCYSPCTYVSDRSGLLSGPSCHCFAMLDLCADPYRLAQDQHPLQPALKTSGHEARP